MAGDGSRERSIEDELLETRLHFEEAEAVAGIGTWVSEVGEHGRLLWSRQTYAIFGVEPSEPLDVERFFSLVHADDRDRVRSASRAAVLSDAPYDVEHRIVRPDGVVRWMHERASVVRDARGEPVRMVGVVRDVTEEHDAGALRQRYEAIVESTTDVVIGLDLLGSVQMWNAAAERVFGWSFEEVKGQRLANFILPPDRADEGAEIRRRIERGESIARAESVRVGKNGKRLVMSASYSPLRGPTGDIVGITVIARDVTDKARMEKQLRHADRLVALGTISAGIAHEINNPLTYVLQNLAIVEQRLAQIAPSLPRGAVSEVLEALGDARDGAERVRGVVRDLKTFARSSDDEVTIVDVRQAIEGAVKLVANDVRLRAELVVEWGGAPSQGGMSPRALPPVRANAARLGQVFVNLLINAAHAIPPEQRDGRVTVRAWGEEGRAVVEVHDNGAGISPEILDHIFDPFFTTKEVGVGTGLGLSICHGIVSGFGGEITATSVRGEGAVFKVSLPAATARPSPPRPSPEVSTSKRARLLVVDDEPRLARIVERTLAPHHDVVALCDPLAALARIESGERFDAILCDVVMPKMSGTELASRIRALDPAQAARGVFMTGAVDAATANGRRAEAIAEGAPRLEKPFDAAQLLSTVGRLVS